MQMWSGVYYAVSAALLIVVNKLCLDQINTPGFLALAQVSTSAVVARTVLWKNNTQFSFDISWLLYVSLFAASIYMNLLLLARTGINVVIVVRACLPLSVSVLEHIFLNRHSPDLQRTSIILTIILSAYGYAIVNIHVITPVDSLYAAVYFSCLSIEMIVAKKLVNTVDPWAATFINNAIATVPMALLAYLGSEVGILLETNISSRTTVLLAASCVLGTSISIFSWKARAELAASAFTVLGIANKFASIWASSLIWANTLTHIQYVFIGTSILSSASYRSMPERIRETSVAEEMVRLKTAPSQQLSTHRTESQISL